MGEREWTQWTESQITNHTIGLTELRFLFPRVEEQLLPFHCYLESPTEHETNDLRMPTYGWFGQLLAASNECTKWWTKIGDGVSMKTLHVWIHFLVRFDDTEGAALISLICSNAHIDAFSSILPVCCQAWQFVPVGGGGGKVPIWHEMACVLGWGVERGDVKKSRGRLAKQFCGSSLTSKEGFSD